MPKLFEQRYSQLFSCCFFHAPFAARLLCFLENTLMFLRADKSFLRDMAFFAALLSASSFAAAGLRPMRLDRYAAPFRARLRFTCFRGRFCASQADIFRAPPPRIFQNDLYFCAIFAVSRQCADADFHEMVIILYSSYRRHRRQCRRSFISVGI